MALSFSPHPTFSQPIQPTILDHEQKSTYVAFLLHIVLCVWASLTGWRDCILLLVTISQIACILSSSA